MKHRRLAALLLLLIAAQPAVGQTLRLNGAGYFTKRGLDVLFFNNWYSGLFSDSKLSGIELVHHGVRTATNGDVRLSNTPEQWDPIPHFDGRDVDRAHNRAQARLSYPEYNFSYRIEAAARGDSMVVRVYLTQPLPKALIGRAGFNLEFLPSAYFEKTYVMDGRSGLLPRAAGSAMVAVDSSFEATPLASGHTLVLAPEDAERRVTIRAGAATISLYDGQNKAQNGWFVVRGLLPADSTGNVLEWVIAPHTIPGWTRQPVIAHSQIGYHPKQAKVAVLEMDPSAVPPSSATLLEVRPDGSSVARLRAPARPWGRYLRYQYATFDFSRITKPGIYVISFAGVRSEPFRIADDVYADDIWHQTLDTYLPVAMDHVLVNDRYRVWHGASHLDDARQAPVNHAHFDLYAQGPATDTPFQGGQHIPGLNVGGWFDAGDFDIRTQSQYALVAGLVQIYETFRTDWDQTTVQEERRSVDLRHPDGVPDILQQIEHGTLWLIAQYRSVGHAINGVVEPTLAQYTHLGDAVTKTDGVAGTDDDRLAFTSRSTALDYGSIAALAAASRVLRTRNRALADSCLATAVRVWADEHSHAPFVFRSGNTTGGRLEDEELKAAVELLVSTQDSAYAARINALWPYIAQHFEANAVNAVRALPYMDAGYRARVQAAVATYKTGMDVELSKNPFGVPISTGGWGGSGAVLAFAMRNYILHQAFPEIIGPEYTLRGLEYVLGRHPSNSVSLVSGVGTHSKTIAYGNNRADYSFIPGGIVPGIVIVQPDLPELEEDWPFLWYENEYVVPEAAFYIYVANAARDLVAHLAVEGR